MKFSFISLLFKRPWPLSWNKLLIVQEDTIFIMKLQLLIAAGSIWENGLLKLEWSVVKTPTPGDFLLQTSEALEKTQGLLDQTSPFLALPLLLATLCCEVTKSQTFFFHATLLFYFFFFTISFNWLSHISFAEEIDPSTYSFTTALKGKLLLSLLLFWHRVLHFLSFFLFYFIFFRCIIW